ncbi:NAD(P)-binding protein [Agrocybe pediades]|nr:NAD(P)-binding protein [Agrocybe pediades]
MTTLITGGTGKTGSILARLLHAANRPFLVASRSGQAPEPFKGVPFNWNDPTTLENPFKADPNIDRVYLIMPRGMDLLSLVAPFIDLAMSKGVKRFVLLTSTQSFAGGPAHGKVHQYLLDKGVDYAVLKPSWFMENFGENDYSRIMEQNEVSSATGDGKIPWVSSEDIAQAAFNELTAEKISNKEYLVLGPELYSYDEAVKILSSVIGREITHRKNTVEQQVEEFTKIGMPEAFSKVLASAQNKFVAQGKEAAFMDAPEDRKYVGKRTLEQYFRENRQIWIKG